jgi:hypothetical protein
MKAEHRISAEGEIPRSPEHHKKRKLDQYLSGYDTATAIENTTLAGFNLLEFRALLLQWVIADNIAFNKIESPHLRRLVAYANPRAQMPSHTLISKWTSKAYDQQLEVVTETLASAITKVSLSFDLWTSGTSVALLGVVAHFIDARGKPTSMLLSLPRQQGKHTGACIADNVAGIVAEYGLERSLSFFIADNASNNATCISALADEFRFSAKAKWIRCSGHVLISSPNRFSSAITQTHWSLTCQGHKTKSCGTWTSGGVEGLAASCTTSSSTSRDHRNVSNNSRIFSVA